MHEVGKVMKEVVDNHRCKTTKHIVIHKAVILEVFHRELSSSQYSELR